MFPRESGALVKTNGDDNTAVPAPVPPVKSTTKIGQRKTLKPTSSSRLRSAPTTISVDEIFAMIRASDFSMPGAEITGNFRHSYETRTISGDAVVFDHATNLMWQQSGSSDTMPRDQALDYVAMLNRERFGGFDNWRLPTIEELASLVEPKQMHGDVYIDPVFGPTQRWCRSADRSAGDRDWGIVFYEGGLYNPIISFPYYIRAVRSQGR